MRVLLADRVARRAGLAAALKDAGRAHHHAFAHVRGEDAAWPAWYAAWLAPRLVGLLARVPLVPALAEGLRTVEHERQALAPDAGWPDYYAEGLLRRYG